MKNYRIKEVTKPGCLAWYYPQTKIFGLFWFTFNTDGGYEGYLSYDKANEALCRAIIKPKSRVIREDFLPEQDQIERYRIKKVTKPGNPACYYPQKKILWFWWTLSESYGTEYMANVVICDDFKDRQKDKVEYIEPDLNFPEPKPHLKLNKTTSQTAPPEPNPPPKVL
jgi:hypothetical protein